MRVEGEGRPGPSGDGPLTLAAGALAFRLEGGAVRSIRFHGVEVVRLVDAPIRDADWRTLAVAESRASVGETPGAVTVARSFETVDGSFAGRLTVQAEAGGDTARLAFDLRIQARRAAEVNRAGFVLLHPIRGVAGTPVAVRHPDGSAADGHFPARISPAQPVRDIAALQHSVDGIRVAVAFEGEVFEMEDQRNWTDASFKTYCRPLSRPRPFPVAAGETLAQRIVIDLAATPGARRPPAAAAAPSRATLPDILLAHDPALAHDLGGTPPSALAGLAVGGLLLRVDAGSPLADPPLPVPVTLEIVADHPDDVAAVAAAAARAGIAPRRVVALPRSYLASHQPEGPWPQPGPPAFLAAARAAFPGTEIGGGMLTNFTEFNRCRPDPALIDFATFGTTAIVHAGDDASVIETLEALADVFGSAAALVPGRPLHLGLVAIGMRSNPYGAAVAPNPDGRRLAMAMEDPRQREDFAAAWAIAAAAEAARAGVASYAPAMTAGPLGLGEDGAFWPVFHAVSALAALAGTAVEVTGGPAGLVRIDGRRGGDPLSLVANLGAAPATVAGRTVAPLGFAILGQAAVAG